MALIRQHAHALLEDARSGRLVEAMRRQARYAEVASGVSEVASWAASIPALLTDLVDAGLGHVEVLLEHKLPFCPKRADAILCGVHPRTGIPSYVLVELKQWTDVIAADSDLVRVPHLPKDVLHPVEQVRRYCRWLVDFTPILAEDPDSVSGIAYLHNARASKVWKLRQYHTDEHGKLFTLDDKALFLAHLRSRLSSDPSTRDSARAAADRLLHARNSPSKPLMTLASREIREREQWVLLDEQQVAYQKVMLAVEAARATRRQTVVIITGGPGSGKSVIALSLLGDLLRQGRTAMHATGSRAFTETLRQQIGSRNGRTNQLFVYFNSFMDNRPRAIEVLICDEAHRLREKSVNRFTSRERRASARAQIDEIIDTADVPVFLLDEHQVVRPGEIGTVADIRAAAIRLGCAVESVDLDGQYRCGGSEDYDRWVLSLLGIEGQPAAWHDSSFKVVTAGSPRELESWLFSHGERDGGTARIAAGFCWPWSDPERDINGDKRLVPDVRIGQWKRPWNAKGEQRIPGVPGSSYWATDPRGFGQVGCVYTAQGFEYDWAGVIFGDDFVRRGDRWEVRPEKSRDPAITNKVEVGRAHDLIRNTYKVLLTRGMRGVCVYSTDDETRAYLASLTSRISSS